MHNNAKRSTMKFVIVAIIVLLSCVIIISLSKKYKTKLLSNKSVNTSEFYSEIIFDDIKIQVNKDNFSHDSIKEESYKNVSIEYLKKI